MHLENSIITDIVALLLRAANAHKRKGGRLWKYSISIPAVYSI